jgi:hypothetical protein
MASLSGAVESSCAALIVRALAAVDWGAPAGVCPATLMAKKANKAQSNNNSNGRRNNGRALDLII